MKRFILISAFMLMLTGCPKQPDTTEQRLAERTAELEKARDSKGFWQSTAAILGSLTFLALVVGIIVGSKAKGDADGK